MTDNSRITLRWVLDDVNTIVARRKTDSKVFNEGGFKWITALDESTTSSKAVFNLHCDANHNGPWKCDVEMTAYVLDNDVHDDVFDYYETYLHKSRYCFDETNRDWRHSERVSWNFFKDFKINGKTTIKLDIKVISSERKKPIADSTLFDGPNRKSNVVIKIGEKKLHVSKEILAIHSPVFDTMFFGNFSENGKEEVEIKDVVHEEFVDLLNLIYTRTVEITDYTIAHILKLSDQFQMEIILEQAKKHLSQSSGMEVMKKLFLADQYRLDALKDHCLDSFTSAAELTKNIKSSPEFARFSDGMKAAICHRMTEF